MKYVCINCKYETTTKGNYNRHLQSVAHKKIFEPNTIVKPIKKLICSYCNTEFAFKQSLSRHKLKSCSEKMKNDNIKNKEFEIMAKLVEAYRIENETIKKQLTIQNQQSTINNNTTYNISVKNYVQQNFPNAPPLKQIEDYSGLEYKDYKLIDTLVYNYNNNILHKYLGGFIVSYYKKDDPSTQSIWSSDNARLTYIVSEIFANNKSVWSHDYKGIKVKEYVIAPLLDYIRKCTITFFRNIEVKKAKIPDLDTIEADFGYRKSVAGIASMIDSGLLIDNILKFIAPYFCIDRDKEIKQITYFIDTEEEEEEEDNYPFVD